MRLIFVHGMRQEGKRPADLQATWETALATAWSRAGLSKPAYELEMPFYGDELNELTEAVRGSASAVVTRGEGGPETFSPLEEALIREMARKQGITDVEVRSDLGQEVVARGPANWEWVQAIGRVLETNVPALRRLGLSFVRQVDAYLTRPHIRAAVDDIVRPSLSRGPAIIVAHSLGTIVAYNLLRATGQDGRFPLLVTVGSPLGIGAVKDKIMPPRPLMRPTSVSSWLNATDERDYVALYARLDRDTFADGIENVSDVHNRQEDAHLIDDYLSNKTVSKRIHDARR
jgi:hypothetical protein